MPISDTTEMKLAEVLGDEKYQQLCNQRNEVLEATKTAGLHSAHWAMKNIEMALQEVVKKLEALEDERDDLLYRIDNARVCI
jgi:NAD-dependent DNA ligase